MSNLAKAGMLILVGALLVCLAFYSALPTRISPVAVIATRDSEAARKIVGDHGGGTIRTFALPPAPRDIPHLGLMLRPATYLEPPSATITVVVGNRDRCTFGPNEYSDAGTIVCPVTQSGARTLRVIVRGSAGPFALIERQMTSGQTVAGIWAQIPARSLGGRVRFVLTALSTTRREPFSWPLTIFGYVFAMGASIGLGLFVLSGRQDAHSEIGPEPVIDSETSV